jgi:hypothetical protein
LKSQCGVGGIDLRSFFGLDELCIQWRFGVEMYKPVSFGLDLRECNVLGVFSSLLGLVDRIGSSFIVFFEVKQLYSPQREKKI